MSQAERFAFALPIGWAPDALVVGDVVRFDPHADDAGQAWGVMTRSRLLVVGLSGGEGDEVLVEAVLLCDEDPREASVVLHLGRSPLMEHLRRWGGETHPRGEG